MANSHLTSQSVRLWTRTVLYVRPSTQSYFYGDWWLDLPLFVSIRWRSDWNPLLSTHPRWIYDYGFGASFDSSYSVWALIHPVGGITQTPALSPNLDRSHFMLPERRDPFLLLLCCCWFFFNEYSCNPHQQDPPPILPHDNITPRWSCATLWGRGTIRWWFWAFYLGLGWLTRATRVLLCHLDTEAVSESMGCYSTVNENIPPVLRYWTLFWTR